MPVIEVQHSTLEGVLLELAPVVARVPDVISLSPGEPQASEPEGPAVTRMVHDLVTAAGGSISAEHGIGQMKRDELARLSPARVAALKAIKSGLDPHDLMNPGKLV